MSFDHTLEALRAIRYQGHDGDSLRNDLRLDTDDSAVDLRSLSADRNHLTEQGRLFGEAIRRVEFALATLRAGTRGPASAKQMADFEQLLAELRETEAGLTRQLGRVDEFIEFLDVRTNQLARLNATAPAQFNHSAGIAGLLEEPVVTQLGRSNRIIDDVRESMSQFTDNITRHLAEFGGAVPDATAGPIIPAEPTVPCIATTAPAFYVPVRRPPAPAPPPRISRPPSQPVQPAPPPDVPPETSHLATAAVLPPRPVGGYSFTSFGPTGAGATEPAEAADARTEPVRVDGPWSNRYPPDVANRALRGFEVDGDRRIAPPVIGED